MMGKVKSFDESKGYGFIITPNERLVFIHHSEIPGEGFKTLSSGQWVEFSCYENTKGKWIARDLIKL